MAMQSDYKIHAQYFLEKVWPYIKNCSNEPYQYRQAIRKFNFHNSCHVLVKSGCVRIALIGPDYVIKFDYCPEEAVEGGGCADEYEFYRFAKKRGYAYLFAETTPYEYHGRIFYIMPRIEGVGRYKDEIYDYLDEEDCDFVAAYLYDMHNENYGWKNGYPVIIDYASNVFLD